MIIDTFDLLIKTYKRAGFSVADALEEALPVRPELLQYLSSQGWELAREMKDIYLYKNGIQDRWIAEDACMLPGFFFEPLERSMRAFMVNRKSKLELQHFEFLVDFGGDYYYIPIGKKK